MKKFMLLPLPFCRQRIFRKESTVHMLLQNPVVWKAFCGGLSILRCISLKRSRKRCRPYGDGSEPAHHSGRFLPPHLIPVPVQGA